MHPDCPKCKSPSTRRIARIESLRHRIMFFFGKFPWECVTCKAKFFDAERYSRKRNKNGEVYTGTKRVRKMKPGAEEVRP
jgi:hypothetical protein